MTILVTGAKGMIGSQLVKGLLDTGHVVIGVDRTGDETCGSNYYHYKADLADKERLQKIADSNKVERFIHLAALAHTLNEDDLSWERYKHINVDCAKNVFEVAGDRPVLLISTVDVFGFYDGKEPVSGETAIHPVSNYGKSKAMAEEECKKLKHYSIFRFSPVYTDTIKRDIQKRYYLKYPNIAYQVGKGTAYEVLNINRAVAEMVNWCSQETHNDIRIIKDEKALWTPDYIKAEKAEGRAKTVLRFPQWMVNCGYVVLKGILGENEKTYLLNKAVHPLRSK
jgi:nucleoside-diphosphate-sugar epimerase